MKKTTLSLAVSAFIFSLSGQAIAASEVFGDTSSVSKTERKDYINEKIISGTVFNQSNLYLYDSHEVRNVTLNQDSILRIDGAGTAVNTVVNEGSSVYLYKFDKKKEGKATIQNTTVNSSGDLNMATQSISKGTLYVAKDADLSIDNVDEWLVDVTANTSAKSTDVFIENLKLAGNADIGPAWHDGENGEVREDGDAPLPEKPGPYLVTKIHNFEMLQGSKMIIYAYMSGAQFNRLEINNLSGTGEFELSTSLADNLSDQIYVTDHASGNFGLLINDSGREMNHPENTRLVYINAGDAQFDLLNKDGIIDIGAYKYRYHLESKNEDGHTEWYLVNDGKSDLQGSKQDSVKKTRPQKKAKKDIAHKKNRVPVEIVEAEKITPPTEPTQNENKKYTPTPIGFSSSTQNVMSMAAVSQHILNTELSTLRQRQGSLSHHNGDMSVWIRHLSDDSHLNNHQYDTLKNRMNGVQIGADKQFNLENGKLRLGGFTSYSKSDVKFNVGGDGDVESYSGGLYATYLSQSGLYADAVMKGNRLKNQLRTKMNAGDIGRADYNQNTFTTALETGYTLPVCQGFTFEPYGRFNYSRIGGADYTLSNGMQVNIRAANSLQGELGALFATHLTLGNVDLMPYARLAVAREFIDNSKVNINQMAFDNDYSGNIGKYGLGVNANITKEISVYAEINYLKGNKVETPINSTAGFKVLF
ncbi:MAG: autotransporter outer membrane beta-barrel domain-containing protein [Enterobacteriaceae bacterium]|nr:autotransporter outer membrane beta-barrel domain-containing protein [Enterobacteriaceae bacterium]